MQRPDFPGYSEYTTQRCCSCQIHHIRGLRHSYVGHWEARWWIPILFFVALAGSLACQVVLFANTWLISISAIFSFLVGLYYMAILCAGPGYLPFFASAPNLPPLPPTSDPSIAGVISNPLQFAWAATVRPPARCYLDVRARRYVIRPAHAFPIAGTWVGKRNHKFFLLFLATLSVHVLLLGGASGMASVKAFSESRTAVASALIVVAALAVGFTVVLIVGLVADLVDVCRNRTQFDGIKDTGYDRGCCSNWSDVCGTRSLWICCLCPWPPFYGISDAELANAYRTLL